MPWGVFYSRGAYGCSSFLSDQPTSAFWAVRTEQETSAHEGFAIGA